MSRVRPFRLCAALVAAASVAAVPVAHADDDVDSGEGSGFEVSLASLPTTVSPPGGIVVIQAETTVPDSQLPATLYVDLPDGSAFRDDLSTGGEDDATCETYDVDVDAEVEEGPTYEVVCEVGTTSAVLDIAAHTPDETGVVTTRALLVGGEPHDGGELYGEAVFVGEGYEYYYPPSAEDAVETTVASPEAGVAAGLVTEGESLRLTLEDGRDYILTVPEGVPGVIAEIRAQDGEGRTCGSGGCGDGFHTSFVPHPVFKAEDPQNPLLTDKTFGPQPPCKGLGACAEIYFAKDPADPTLEPMPSCAGARGGAPGSGVADPSPCVNQRYKQGKLIWFDVRMLSNDPLEVPPLRL